MDSSGFRLVDRRIIPNPKGDVYRGYRLSEDCLDCEEVYFSRVNKDDVKGWKCHTKQSSNLIVVYGKVRVFIAASRPSFRCTIDHASNFFDWVDLSDRAPLYKMLSIKPGNWFAFHGLATESVLCNLSDRIHEPGESITFDF